MRGALDYLTVFFLSGYGDRPLHLLGSLGVWLLAFGMAAYAYLGFAMVFLHERIGGRPLLIVGTLLLLTGRSAARLRPAGRDDQQPRALDERRLQDRAGSAHRSPLGHRARAGRAGRASQRGARSDGVGTRRACERCTDSLATDPAGEGGRPARPIAGESPAADAI